MLPIPAAILDVQHDTAWTILVASLFVTMFTSYGDFLVEGALTLDIRHREEVGAYPRLRELIRQARPHLLHSARGDTDLLDVHRGRARATGRPGAVRSRSLERDRSGDRGRDAVACVESFRRSNALVRGHSWTVLWSLLIILVVSAFVETGFDNLLYPLPEFFASWLGHFLVSVITAPYAAHALAVIYFGSRLSKSGPARSS